MRIYWYWPHPHKRANPLALAALRPGDTLTVQALPSLRGERFPEIAEYEVIRDLPDPTLRQRGGRALRPVQLTVARSRARARLLRQGFDVAHIQMLVYQSDWVDLARLRRRTTLVSMVHDVRPHRPGLPSWAEQRILKRLYAVAGDLVVFHQALKDQLCDLFRVEPERVHVVPLPIKAAQEGGADLENRDRPMILFFGSLRRNKGLPILLQALRIAGPEIDADVVIAGSGDPELEQALRSHAERLPDLTVEIGHVGQERKHELLSRATCVVLPYTTSHSQSGVLADAYSYRVPIVASDVGAIGPTVRADGTGVVVPPGDPTALAEGMRQVVHGLGGEYEPRLHEAAARHDYSVVGPQLRAIYDIAYSRSRYR